MNVFMILFVWWWCTTRPWLATKVSVLSPLCSFAVFKRWKILSCFWFCCCSCVWCLHDFCFLMLLMIVFWCCWWLFFDVVDDCFFESWLATKVSVLSPLCSFTVFKGWKVLSCFWFRCCSVTWCFHNFYILILFVV